jgi:hypothetical protein
MTRRLIAASAACLLPLLAACGDRDGNAASPAVSTPAAEAPETVASGTVAPGEQGGTDDWRAVAGAADRARLDRLDAAWREGLQDARQAGFGDDIRALGALADPDAGLSGRLQPPPGEYSCRTIKLGRIAEYGGYLSYPGFRCVVELTPGGDLILTKVTGSQRTRGLIYPDTDGRLVFLGAQAWGAGETGYPNYGQQAERDQIGVIERIGDTRWRLVLPWPKQESKLDILELTR